MIRRCLGASVPNSNLQTDRSNCLQLLSLFAVWRLLGPERNTQCARFAMMCKSGQHCCISIGFLLNYVVSFCHKSVDIALSIKTLFKDFFCRVAAGCNNKKCSAWVEN